MDRAVVHTKEEKLQPCDELVWMDKLPFSVCPKRLIDQLEEKPFTYEEYLRRCAKADGQGLLWNTAFVYQGKYVVAFAWGLVDLFDKSMRISHLTANPCLFKVGKKFLLSFYYHLCEVKREKGLKRIYWESVRWKAFERKCTPYAKVLPTRVLEVI